MFSNFFFVPKIVPLECRYREMFVTRSSNMNCGLVRFDESEAFGGESFNTGVQ